MDERGVEMTGEQLEIAAYAAAHSIYGLQPDVTLACPSAIRSRFVDAIAGEIKRVLEIHVRELTEAG